MIPRYTSCPGAVCGWSLIVPTPAAVASVAFTGLPKLTVKVSSGSATVSAMIGIVIVSVVAPAGMLSLPDCG
jgi:hypothetical protein